MISDGPERDNGSSIIKITDVKAKQGIYRFFAEITQPNKITNANVKVFFIKRDSVKVIERPHVQSKSHLKYWDLGFINCPDENFVEINAFTTYEITLDYKMREFGILAKFLNNSKVELKNILGKQLPPCNANSS